MATANDIIKRAFRQINVKGISEPLTGDESAAALTTLNDMLAAWGNEQLMVYQKKQRTKALTSSDGQYTIGSGGDIDVTRPLRIAKAFVQDSNGYDTPLEMLDFRQWADICDKDLATTYPLYLYYRPNYPLGEINLYPEPGTGITLYLEVWDQFTAFSALTTSVSLPPGYEKMLALGLALDLANEYHPPDRITMKLERAFLRIKETIKDVNNVSIPQLKTDNFMPTGSITGGEWIYP